MIQCPTCRKKLDDRAFQCDNCGTVLYQPYCNKCNAPLDLRYPKCIICNAPYTLPYGNPYLIQPSQTNTFQNNINNPSVPNATTSSVYNATTISSNNKKANSPAHSKSNPKLLLLITISAIAVICIIVIILLTRPNNANSRVQLNYASESASGISSSGERILSGKEEENMYATIMGALYTVGYDRMYNSSYGEALTHIMISGTHTIKETRQKHLYSCFLSFRCNNNYIAYQEIKASNADTLPYIMDDLTSPGELCIYYDSSRKKIIHIDYTTAVSDAMEIYCISNINNLNIINSNNMDKYDYDCPKYEYGSNHIGYSTILNSYTLDTQDRLPIKTITDQEASMIMREEYSYMDCTIEIVDKDGYNRFIGIVREQDNQIGSVIWVSFDTNGIYMRHCSIIVGTIDTMCDILPCDNVDTIINHFKTTDCFAWGKPCEIGPSVSTAQENTLEYTNTINNDSEPIDKITDMPELTDLIIYLPDPTTTPTEIPMIWLYVHDNPEKDRYYHTDINCEKIKDPGDYNMNYYRITYEEVFDDYYSKLQPCKYCGAPER